jgi:hypothetical protein
MRCSSKVLFRKFNQFRKQNWSAPTTMSVFIIICMIWIFSLESLGLLHKEKNLSYRVAGPEGTIKLLSEEMKISETKACKDCDEESLIKSEEELSEMATLSSHKVVLQSKDERILSINKILLSAAGSQIYYEYNTDSLEEYVENLVNYDEFVEEEIEAVNINNDLKELNDLSFFDI